MMLVAAMRASVTARCEEFEWLEFQDDAHFVDEIKELVNHLPKRVIRKLSLKGGISHGDTHVVVVNSTSYLQAKYGRYIMEINDYSEGTIYVASSDYQGISKEGMETAVMGAFLHEIGHRFDIVCFGYSNSKEFQEIYEQEKEAFKASKAAIDFGSTPNYSVSNEHEFFASVFAEYLMFPEELQELCPQSYALMAFYVDPKKSV